MPDDDAAPQAWLGDVGADDERGGDDCTTRRNACIASFNRM